MLATTQDERQHGGRGSENHRDDGGGDGIYPRRNAREHPHALIVCESYPSSTLLDFGSLTGNASD
jgi:hypothetical protein